MAEPYMAESMVKPGVPAISIVRDDGLGADNPRFEIDGVNWVLSRGGLENFDGIEHSVSTGDYAQYDGGYLLSERSPVIDRTITCFSRLPPEEARAEAERFFIPRHLFEVHVRFRGRARFCAGRQLGFRLDVSSHDVQQATWTCLSLDPFWLSEDEKRFDLAQAAGSFGFPFRSFRASSWTAPLDDRVEVEAAAAKHDHIDGFVTGVRERVIRMSNHGSASAYPRFDITASGAVEEPEVTVKDAAGRIACRVAFALSLEKGDELVVDFGARPASISLNGSNVSHLVKPGSTLAAGIDVGEFTVEWGAKKGDAALHIKPSIRERFTTI